MLLDPQKYILNFRRVCVKGIVECIPRRNSMVGEIEANLKADN